MLFPTYAFAEAHSSTAFCVDPKCSACLCTLYAWTQLYVCGYGSAWRLLKLSNLFSVPLVTNKLVPNLTCLCFQGFQTMTLLPSVVSFFSCQYPWSQVGFELVFPRGFLCLFSTIYIRCVSFSVDTKWNTNTRTLVSVSVVSRLCTAFPQLVQQLLSLFNLLGNKQISF